MEEFENRVAIVTGTTGIARAIAKRLATGGCRVVSCGIEAVGNAELEQEAKQLWLISEGRALRRQSAGASPFGGG